MVIRLPKFFSDRDRCGEVQDVDWIAAFPGHYSPMAPVFKEERKKLTSIRRKLWELTPAGNDQLVRCERSVVILHRVAAQGSDRVPSVLALPVLAPGLIEGSGGAGL